jgi:hypothetical protein
VEFVDTTSSTLKNAEQALLRQAFLASTTTRTIPKIVEWVEKTLSASSVSKEKAELAAVVAAFPSHEEGVEAAAIQLLRGTGLLRIEEVRDIDSCVEHFSNWMPGSASFILTDEAILKALSAVPGGEAFAATTSLEEIRTELSRAGFGIEHLGDEKLKPFLEKDECAPGALVAANRIIIDPTRFLGVALSAISRAQDDEERLTIETLLNQVGSRTPVPVLIAPKLKSFRADLVKYLKDTPPGVSDSVKSDLLTVFDPTPHYLRPDRNFGGHRQLMQLVYDDLIVNSSWLAYDAFDKDENLRRITSLLDRPGLDARQLYSYRKLYQLCQSERAYVRQPPVAAPAVPLFSSLAEGYAAVESLAHERAVHRGHRLILPSRQEFGSIADRYGADPVAALELQTGQSYEAVISRIAQRQGYAFPGRSEPHRVMNQLVLEAIGPYLVSDPIEEYSNAALFERQRIDLFASVEYERPGELLPQRADICFEADGAQHFTPVAYWGGSSKGLTRDRKKAELVIKATKTRPITLLALHHEVLTGSRRKRLSVADLANLVDYCVAQQLPWVFVRPVGSCDMRATPNDMRPELLRQAPISKQLEAFTLAPAK